MNIKFYITEDVPITLNKILKNEIVFDCSLKNDFDVLTPVITLKIPDVTKFNYNYCIIDDFKRNYFINKVEVVNLNIIKIYLKVDVLETYKDYIKVVNAIFKVGGNNNYSKNIDYSTKRNCKTYVSDVKLDIDYNQKILITLGG